MQPSDLETKGQRLFRCLSKLHWRVPRSLLCQPGAQSAFPKHQSGQWGSRKRHLQAHRTFLGVTYTARGLQNLTSLSYKKTLILMTITIPKQESTLLTKLQQEFHTCWVAYTCHTCMNGLRLNISYGLSISSKPTSRKHLARWPGLNTSISKRGPQTDFAVGTQIPVSHWFGDGI